jgi:hypothetical protein
MSRLFSDPADSGTVEATPSSEASTEESVPKAEPEGSEETKGLPEDGTGSTESEDGSADADIEALIQQFAKEHHLDLEDEHQKLIAKRLADKEAMIQKLQKGAAATGAKESKNYLADFQKKLDGEAAAAAEDTEETPEVTPTEKLKEEVVAAPSDRLKLNDIGDVWENGEQAAEAYNAAWQEGNYRKASEIETSLFKRRMLSIGLPFTMMAMEKRLESFKSELLQKDLGDVLPSVRRSVQQEQQSQAHEMAVTELKSIPGLKPIVDTMFDADSEEPLIVDGEKFPNSPLNRVLAENDELLKINVEHKDPIKAKALTLHARFLAAAKLIKAGQNKGISRDEAKDLVRTGATIAKRENGQDRVRQGLNAGSGATGLGKPKTEKTYVDTLVDLPGNKLSRLFE